MPSPIRFKPRSASDALDEANVQPGACSILSDLIFDPSTPMVLYSRPAAVVTTGSSFVGFSSPAFVSVFLTVGTLVYGMIASARNSGKDEPFVFDTNSQTFLTVTGITNTNTPTSPATTGGWTPPTMHLNGSKVIVTHPGFSGGGINFGWFDISAFSTTVTANTDGSTAVLTGNPTITGVNPGMAISGTGIPANSTVISTAAFSATITGTFTNGSTSVTGVTPTTGLANGQSITGTGIPSGTTFTISGSTITLSQNYTGTSGSSSGFVVSATITISANTTSANNQETVTVTGGTATSPKWAAGNTNTNGLLGIPQAAALMFGRTYYAYLNSLTFSDVGNALNVANATDVLVCGDSLDILALASLPETTTSQGIIQALLAFKENLIWQVTGDAATNNLLVNNLNTASGTLAPRSCVPTVLGIFFMSEDGVRIVSYTGQVSNPLPDVQIAFINATVPSRVSAAFNAGIYRICLQNSALTGQPYQEWWYDTAKNGWSGPHTFRQDCAQAFLDSFMLFNGSTAIASKLWTSDWQQTATSVFIENGTQLISNFQTSPLKAPESGGFANSCVLASANVALPSSSIINFAAFDDQGNYLASAALANNNPVTLWNNFQWGTANWVGASTPLAMHQIPWDQPLAFSRLIIAASANSASQLRIGNLEVIYQPLGYLMS